MLHNESSTTSSPSPAGTSVDPAGKDRLLPAATAESTEAGQPVHEAVRQESPDDATLHHGAGSGSANDGHMADSCPADADGDAAERRRDEMLRQLRAGVEEYFLSDAAVTVSEALALFRERHRERPDAQPSRLEAEVARAAALFIELNGDRALGAITEEEVHEFKSLLSVLPRNLRLDKVRGSALRDLAHRQRSAFAGQRPSSEEDTGLISLSTVNRHLKGMGRLFNEFDLHNPFHGKGYGRRATRETRPRIKRWSQADLDAFFASTLYTGCLSEAQRAEPGSLVIKDSLYWAPLLSRHAGLRACEIASLDVSSVRDVAGITVLRVGDDSPHDSARNIRLVPLADVLITHGFLEFVKDRQHQGETYLFPELHGFGADKAAELLHRRLGTYMNSVVPGRRFMGFRVTFAHDIRRQAGMTPDMFEYIMGVAGPAWERSLLPGPNLPALKAAIDMLS